MFDDTIILSFRDSVHVIVHDESTQLAFLQHSLLVRFAFLLLFVTEKNFSIVFVQVKAQEGNYVLAQLPQR